MGTPIGDSCWGPLLRTPLRDPPFEDQFWGRRSGDSVLGTPSGDTVLETPFWGPYSGDPVLGNHFWGHP